jgi:DNA-binding transcriptional MocR family regulator
MCTDSLPSGAAALIHVTPEHQRPLGVTLAFKRRLALLEWAQQSRAFVLEEDCDGELRYGDLVAVPSLMSLDKSEQVILLGGFAKSLGPWINTAYVALPASLVTEAIELRRLLDDSHVLLEEHALADLLHSGLYARHIHQLSRVYSARRDALVRALDNTFGSRQTIWGGAAGLAVTWFHPADLGPPTSIDARARTLGLEARSVRVAHSQRCALQIGFGHLAEDRLAERVARLASSMQPSALTAMSAD